MIRKWHQFLNESKKYFQGGDMEDFSLEERESIEKIPSQNPYGVIVLVLGGASFMFGPTYGFLPIVNLILFSLTLITFDKEKEDNPWTFYLGAALSFIGLYMYIMGFTHHFTL
ncbi:cell division protein FtsK [Falsibacillus albus]|uniref:Cell division protein FtsK n=1 Tax=Falsibacillus albus TaxID=2478915 RepID=A0A3L7K0U1_9BACI|nr:cell division protein FtsK [Falsibacillus albus]RLQ94262.1 cell division protein FtsK [Falsibacillus albus]